MSDTTTTTRTDSDGPKTPRPVPVDNAADRPPDRSLWLDREHQELVDQVRRCDGAEDQDETARTLFGHLNEQTQEVLATRGALGSDAHVEACRRCRWFPYQRALAIGARLAWMLDAILWGTLWGGLWWMWVRYYERTAGAVPGWLYFPGVLAVPLLGYICAKVAKGLGQHTSVTRFTNPRSVAETVDRQVWIAGATAVTAGLLLLAILALVFFSPASWSAWVTYVSSMLGFGANVALGLSAGIGGNAAQLLAKPAERDTLDCLLEMKDHTRKHLERFLLVVLLTVGVVTRTNAAVGGAWVWAIDATSSVDPEQREAGINAMVGMAVERAESLGANVVLVIRFSNDSLLADMTWVPVPTRPIKRDCERATPEFVLSKGLIGLSPLVAEGRREAAVEACLALEDAERRSFAQETEHFGAQLRVASRVTPRGDAATCIVPLLTRLVTRSYVLAIDCLTDGIDNSGTPLGSLRVPARVPVTMILARPDPKRRAPTLGDVLRASNSWGRVDGVSVTSVSEYPGFVRAAAGR